MKMNKRGVVEIAVALYCVIAFLGGIILWKPVSNLLGIGNTPQKTKSTMSKKSETKPVIYYTDEKGNKYVAYSTKIEENTLDTSEESKLTIWQKLKNLGFWGIVLAVIFPSFGVWLFRIIMSLKGNITQLVTGIEEAKREMPPDAVAKLETNLSKKTDLSTKKLVKQIKVKL